MHLDTQKEAMRLWLIVEFIPTIRSTDLHMKKYFFVHAHDKQQGELGWKAEKSVVCLEISSLHVQFSTEKINETIDMFLPCYCTFWNSLVKS